MRPEEREARLGALHGSILTLAVHTDRLMKELEAFKNEARRWLVQWFDKERDRVVYCWIDGEESDARMIADLLKPRHVSIWAPWQDGGHLVFPKEPT